MIYIKMWKCATFPFRVNTVSIVVCIYVSLHQEVSARESCSEYVKDTCTVFLLLSVQDFTLLSVMKITLFKEKKNQKYIYK